MEDPIHLLVVHHNLRGVHILLVVVLKEVDKPQVEDQLLLVMKDMVIQRELLMGYHKLVAHIVASLKVNLKQESPC